MARQVANVDIITDTFEIWLLQTNLLLHSLSTEIITANSTVATTGNTDVPRLGQLIGSFGANTIAVSDNMRGGNVSNGFANLNIQTNTIISNTDSTSLLFQVANGTLSSNVTVNSFKTGIFTGNSTAMSVGANLIANSSALLIGNTTQNSVVTQSSIVVGNSSVNTTIVANSSDAFINTGGYLRVTGNAVLSNTLSVVGAATLSNTLAVTGNTTVSNTLSVTGNATLSNTLSVVGATSLSNTLAVTGNASLSNTLSVIGNTSLSNTLSVAGAATLSNTIAVTGNATLSNTLSVVGAATLSNTIAVTGNATLSNTLSVSGAANLSNTLAVAGNTTLSSALNVTGSAVLSNTLSVTGNTTIANQISITGNVNLTTATAIIANSSPGTNGQLLTTNGTSVYWYTLPIPQPGGTNTSVMFNDSGSFGGGSGFTFNKSTNNVTIANSVTIGNVLTVNGSVQLGNNVLQNGQLRAYKEFLQANTSTTGSTSLDLSQSNVFRCVLVGNTTFTFANPPSTGIMYSFTLVVQQDSTGGRTITWPASAKWPGALLPPATTTANAVDVWNFITYDGGSTYLGTLSGKDVR